MTPVVRKRFIFIGRSMLWSLLLYMVTMLATNWDDVANRIKGRTPVAVRTEVQPDTENTPASITTHTSIIRDLTDLLRTIDRAIRPY